MPIVSEAYADGLGWLSQTPDGTYCGTMGENRALEAIRLNNGNPEAGENAPEFEYRVYLKNSGWTDWVAEGETAGSPGSGDPIKGIDVRTISY